MLYGIELPILYERGYLAACSKNLAAGCKVFNDNKGAEDYETERKLLSEIDEEKKSALVAQPAERRFRNPAL